MNAAHQIIEAQLNGRIMEARIARIESDVGHIKNALDALKGRFKAANDTLSVVKDDVTTMKATLTHLATRKEISAVEGSVSENGQTRIGRWAGQRSPR